MLSTVPTKSYPPIESVINNDLTEDDMLTYVYSIICDEHHRLTYSQELHQFNKFISEGIHHIIKNLFHSDIIVPNERNITPKDNMIKAFNIKLTFTHTHVDKPKHFARDGREIPRHPDDYRKYNVFYTSDLILSIKISLIAIFHNGTTEQKETILDRINVSAIPIMVRSVNCNTYGATPKMLEDLNEDVDDTGGYFIAAGKEYVINALENLAYNKPLIFKSTLKNERVRATLISQGGGPFENSTQIQINYLADGGVTINLQASTFIKTKIPFYIIYRILGKVSEEEITRMIVHDIELNTPISNKLLDMVIKSFQCKYVGYDEDKNIVSSAETGLEMYDNMIELVDQKAYRKYPEAIKFAYNLTLDRLDQHLLPHMGITEHSREGKLMLISSLIRDIMCVHIGIKMEDDRDHLANKRAHGAGLSLAKTFKTLFSNKVHMPIMKKLQDELRDKSFDLIKLSDLGTTIRTLISGDELKTSFEKYINASETSTTRMKDKVRISAQPLERKNKLNVILTMRSVTCSIPKVNRATKRADMARLWHPSACGIYCPADSKEGGEKVGTIKQLAITAIISDTKDGMSYILKESIRNDKNTPIIKIQNLNPVDMSRKLLAKVFVDGDWIGCVDKPYNFVSKYRKLRREESIDRYISIEWNSITNEVCFYTDLGRLMRPLLIVDNNLDDYLSGKSTLFVQNIRLTLDHIKGIRRNEISFQHLFSLGFIEYIYPGEETLVCPNITTLHNTRNSANMRWTHLEIPHAVYGLCALEGSFLERNAPIRNTLITVHAKQACGQPITNIGTATRRNQRFHMLRVHQPLVKTIVRDILPPNSQNLMVAYMTYWGANQEDSSIVHEMTHEFGMFNGIYYKMEFIEIDKNQIIKVPKEKETLLYKHNMSYKKLDEDGIISIGSIVEKGDITIGILMELATNGSQKEKYIDKSTQYTNEESGRVVDIVKKLDGSKRFIMMTFEYERKFFVGDKATSRSGNKNVMGLSIKTPDMPHTRDGMRPDIILNPASLPSRMTMSQLYETTLQKYCAKKGIIMDGTVYRSFDTQKMLEVLEEEGVAMRETMINGTTGEAFDAMIFFGPQTFFRMPKFVIEDRHAVGRTGPTNPQTSQAITGKRIAGGHKVGEMEIWVLFGQGAMSIMFESFYLDSDYRKMYICRGCNEMAIYNEKISRYKCNMCKEKTDISVVDSCKTSMLVLYELASCNIKIKTVPEGKMFEVFE